MGYAACFDSAMNHVAPTLGLKPTKSSTTVGVGIGQKPDGAFWFRFRYYDYRSRFDGR